MHYGSVYRFHVLASSAVLEEHVPKDQNFGIFIGSYAKKVIKYNLKKYILLSLEQTTYVSSHIPTQPVHFNHYDFKQSGMWQAYFRLYEFFWTEIIDSKILVISTSSLLVFLVLLKGDGEGKINIIFSFYCMLIWLYGVTLLIFSTDGDVVRQRAIFDDMLATSFFLNLSFVLSFLFNYLNTKKFQISKILHNDEHKNLRS